MDNLIPNIVKWTFVPANQLYRVVIHKVRFLGLDDGVAGGPDGDRSGQSPKSANTAELMCRDEKKTYFVNIVKTYK